MPFLNQPPRVPSVIAGPRRLIEDDASANSLGGSLLAGASDPDPFDVLRIAAVNGAAGGPVAGRYGVLTWNPTTGAYSYTLDNSLSAVQALGAGSLVRERFDVVVADLFGGTATTRLQIDIGGANDAPRAKPVAAALTEDAPTSIATGNLLAAASDPDRGDVLRIASVDGMTGGVAQGRYGVLGWNATTGGYTYTLDNARAATDALKAGETAQERFRFVVADGKGGSAEANLTISVTGANDAPRSPGVTAAVTEGDTAAPGPARALDLLAGATDPERDAIGVASVAGLTGAGSVEGLYGTLTWDGSGGATYVLDNARAATNGLRAGQVATDVFAYGLTDGAGALGQAAITISVTGTNDAPVNAGANLAAAEHGTAPGFPFLYAADLLAGARDPDGDPLTVLSLAGMTDPGIVQGAYGTLIWAGDGTAAYQVTAKALKPGQVAEERFAYTIADGQGGSATADLVVTVTGANDAPEAQDQLATLFTTLRGSFATGNLLTGATDPDSDPVRLLSIEAGALGTTLQTTYGSIRVQANGNYSYTLNPSKAAYIALPGGQTAFDTLGFTVGDGQGGTDTAVLRIAIPGRNDAAFVSGPTTGSVAEDGVLTASGQLTITDPDAGEARFRTPATLAGTYGSFAFDPLTGAWSYALNNASAKVQSLHEGQTVQDRLDVLSLDGTAGRTLTVLIAGQGAPLAVTADTLFGTEGQTLFFGFGAIGIGLPPTETLLSNDLPGEGSPVVLGGSFELAHGLLVLGSNGSVAYTPNDPDFFGRDDFDYTIRDASGGEATGHLAIFIQNVPDPLPALALGGLAARGAGFAVYGPAGAFLSYTIQGAGITALGDFNGDGRPDLGLGAFGIDAAFVAYGAATAGDIDLARIPGGTAIALDPVGARFNLPTELQPGLSRAAATAVVGLGDVNGDGRGDLAVASLGVTTPTPGLNGEIDVILGHTSFGTESLAFNLAMGQAYRIVGGDDIRFFGLSIADAGDVNGDGRADLLIGTQVLDGDGWTGGSFLVFGGAGTPGGTLSLNSLAADGHGFRIDGAWHATGSTEAYAADIVGAAGDVNGDGLADLLVSNIAPDLEDSILAVVFGKAGTAPVDLAGFDTAGQGFRILTHGWAQAFSGLGDVNGDGLADILVVRPPWTATSPVLASIVFGKTDGAVVDLETVGGGAGGLRITDAAGRLGGGTAVVNDVGDLNGDGRHDLFVAGAPFLVTTGASATLALGVVVFTPADGGDVDIAAAVAGIGGFAVLAPDGPNAAGWGRISATALGDIDGDGLDDFAVGLSGTVRADRPDGGGVFVVHGQAGWAIDTPLI